MSHPTVTRSARWLVLALLALAVVAIAVPLALERLEVAADPRRIARTWSAGQAWAAVVLGVLAGLILALLVRPRRRRLGMILGVAVALAAASFAVWRAAPAAAPVPACGAARPATAGEWQIDARTLVDGEQRDSLALRIEPGSRGEPLLGGLLGELQPAAAEDLGTELLHGGTIEARHCRALVSGSQVTAALPLLADGTAGRPLVPDALPVWRGSFDWWVGAGGELVGARFSVGGHPADAWPVDALRGQLLVELWPAWMIDR